MFEEKLVFAGIPYRVYGGLRFFDRAEIKNALAYLRLVANRDDDTSFERVVNVPARSIGAKTVDAIRAKARELDLSLWHATIALLKSGKPAARTANALNHFLVLIDGFAADFVDLDLPEKIQRVTEKSGLIDLYRRERATRARLGLKTWKNWSMLPASSTMTSRTRRTGRARPVFGPCRARIG